ncbi:MAG: aspartate aminotransferase family protein [Verrucomicrobiae bacterium]|nr:aspartate aminotransferase family protein [Verrucomicrobiae bacterium]
MRPLRVSKTIPGPRSRTLAARLRRYESRNVTFVSPQFPIFWKKSRGSNVWDVDGNRYLDMTSGFGVSSLGFNAPVIVSALRTQSKQLLHVMGDVHPSALKADLCQELSRVTFERWGAGRAKVILGNSGFEAVEAALKTSLLATGRRGILAFEGGYHGLGLGSLETTGWPVFRTPFCKMLGGFCSFHPYPRGDDQDMQQAEKSVLRLVRSRGIGAVLVEPVLGRGGHVVPPEWFLPMLRRVCDQEAILLIFDEIYTGFGKTGRMFACEGAEGTVVPDLICLGKALTGGFPLSACVGRADLMDRAWPESSGEALHTSTYLGHPVGCAMARASIRAIHRPGLLKSVAHKGGYFLGLLRRELDAVPRVAGIHGKGLLLGIEMKQPGTGHPDPEGCTRVMIESLQQGLIVLGGGLQGNVLSLTPVFGVTETEMKCAAFILHKIMKGL